MQFFLTDILAILIIYQSIVFIASLIINKKSKAVFAKVLIGICLLLIAHFVYMILDKQSTLNLFLGPFFGLLYGPFYFIYTQSLILKSFKNNRFWLHFIPAILVLVGLLFFTPKSIFTIDFITIFVIIHLLRYLIWSLRKIYGYRKLLKDSISTFHDISLFWLELILYFQIGIIALVLVENFYQSLLPSNGLILIIYSLTLLLLNCLYYLGLKQVYLFKGIKESHQPIFSSHQYDISEELFDQYVKSLESYMEQNQPYLEYDLSIQDLSKNLNISIRNLSHIINRHFSKNFYDFINQYRLKQAKAELKNTDKAIKEIMYDCGFSNKSTFNSIFKKSTGSTPSAYRRNLK